MGEEDAATELVSGRLTFSETSIDHSLPFLSEQLFLLLCISANSSS